jgi:hypothetical protein
MNRAVSLSFIMVVLASAKSAIAADLVFPTQFDWGQVSKTTTSVELRVESRPADGVIRIPRFNSPYKRITLQGDTTSTLLDFRPEVAEWLITLPKTTAVPATIVIETVGTPQLLAQPFVAEANREGSFILPAHHAVVHGKLLRYEPQPHKNTVGYWADEKDWCEWKVDVDKSGSYDVYILQGCGKGHGGSEVRVSVGKSDLTFIVEDTGHFQNFKERMVGMLELTDGEEQSLKVVPISKAKVAIMDVRQIRLVPSAGQRQ